MPNIEGKSTTPQSERDEWRTLPSLYKWLYSEFKFAYDFAATKENALTDLYQTDALNAEKWFTHWPGVPKKQAGFLNPPFSRMGEFLAKANEQILVAGVEYNNPVIVCLVKADSPEASWWRDNVVDENGFARHEIAYLYPRLPYCNPDGVVKSSPRFASALIIMRPIPWQHVRWVNWKLHAGVK